MHPPASSVLSALLGEGSMWWIFCWIALSAPLAIIAVCVARAKR
jgi:hypothetical protein